MKHRIIFCIPELLIGGVEIALCELLFALNQLGLYEISVITRKRSGGDRFDAFFHNNSDIVLYDMSLKWKWFRFIERPLRKFLIKRKLKEFDVIVDFKYSDFLKFHRKITTPKLCWLHCSFQHIENNIGIDSFLGYDRIICVSKSLAKDIQNHYSELKEKVVPIYNPLNVSIIENKAQERLFPTNRPYFVAVQRLSRVEKDVATIIKAFNLFVNKYSNYFLYIVGGGGKNIKNI